MTTKLEELINAEQFTPEFMALIAKKGKSLKADIKSIEESIELLEVELKKARDNWNTLEEGLESKDYEMILSIDKED